MQHVCVYVLCIAGLYSGGSVQGQNVDAHGASVRFATLTRFSSAHLWNDGTPQVKQPTQSSYECSMDQNYEHPKRTGSVDPSVVAAFQQVLQPVVARLDSTDRVIDALFTVLSTFIANQTAVNAKQEAFIANQTAVNAKQEAFIANQTAVNAKHGNTLQRLEHGLLNEPNLMQAVFDVVDRSLFETSGCLGSLLVDDQGGKSITFQALHCFTSLYGEFAAALYQKTARAVFQHVFRPMNLADNTDKVSTLFMAVFHPTSDLAVCSQFRVDFKYLTGVLDLAAMRVTQYIDIIQKAAAAAHAAQAYTSAHKALDVHVRAMVHGIPTSAGSIMRVSNAASIDRLHRQLPPIELGGSSHATGPRVLASDDTPSATLSQLERDAIEATDAVYHPGTRALLQTAYIAHGSTPPGHSGSAVWAVNRTAPAYTTQMVAVVSGYDNVKHQSYMSPISVLYPALAALQRELTQLVQRSLVCQPPAKLHLRLGDMHPLNAALGTDELLQQLRQMYAAALHCR